jgi:hypothetical protein
VPRLEGVRLEQRQQRLAAGLGLHGDGQLDVLQRRGLEVRAGLLRGGERSVVGDGLRADAHPPRGHLPVRAQQHHGAPGLEAGDEQLARLLEPLQARHLRVLHLEPVESRQADELLFPRLDVVDPVDGPGAGDRRQHTQPEGQEPSHVGLFTTGPGTRQNGVSEHP